MRLTNWLRMLSQGIMGVLKGMGRGWRRGEFVKWRDGVRQYHGRLPQGCLYARCQAHLAMVRRQPSTGPRMTRAHSFGPSDCLVPPLAAGALTPGLDEFCPVEPGRQPQPCRPERGSCLSGRDERRLGLSSGRGCGMARTQLHFEISRNGVLLFLRPARRPAACRGMPETQTPAEAGV
jgi:hypothetical protein